LPHNQWACARSFDDELENHSILTSS